MNKTVSFYRSFAAFFLACALLAIGCSSTGEERNEVSPPETKKILRVVSQHHVSRNDYFQWLGDAADEAVVPQIENENRYAIHSLLKFGKREAQGDSSRGKVCGLGNSEFLPVNRLGWAYRFEEESGHFHPILFRSGEKQKQEIFNPNKFETLDGHDLSLSNFEFSPDGNFLVLGVEVVSRARQWLFLIDLTDERRGITEMTASTGRVFWTLDSKGLYCIETNLDNKLQELVLRRVAKDSQEKKVLFQEKNPGRRLRLSRTASGKYLVLDSFDGSVNELLLVPLRTRDRLDMVIPRQSYLSCAIDHQDDLFFLVSSHENPNRGVYMSDNPHKELKLWNALLSPQEGARILSAVYPSEHLVLMEEDLLSCRIRAIHRYNLEPSLIASTARDKRCALHYSPGMGSAFSYSIQSPVLPPQRFRVDLLHREEKDREAATAVQSAAKLYSSQIVQASGNDGAPLPLVIFSQNGLIPDSRTPALMILRSLPQEPDPWRFNELYRRLMDKGILLVLFQARACMPSGEEAEDKVSLSYRSETVNDLISCADFLINQRWVHPDRLAVMGHEDSCWTIGSVLNFKPSLFACAILHSPILDPISLLMESTDPLKDERTRKWGDPNDKVEFDVLYRFSPYEQLEPKDYPPVLAISDQANPRIPFWQALKWGNKLRLLNTSMSPVFLYTSMDKGKSDLTAGQMDSLQENFLVRFLEH